jgi:hypothetical protein
LEKIIGTTLSHVCRQHGNFTEAKSLSRELDEDIECRIKRYLNALVSVKTTANGLLID